MDEKEILWRYDRAENQNQMITILHELTLIPEYQIMILIINSGRELPERKVTALKKRRITVDKAIAKKEADFAKFAKRADDAIRELEAEKRMITIVLKGGETKTWKTKDKTAQRT